MSWFCASMRRRWLLIWLVILVLGLSMTLPASPVYAQGEGAQQPAAGGEGAEPLQVLFTAVQYSTIGFLVFMIFVLITMVIWLVIDIRGGVAMPLDFVSGVEDAVNKRRFKEAFEMAKGDTCMIARVMTAGMTRLQHGLQEARDASAAVTESLKARKDHLLSYLATIGTIGPLLGLVGTVTGMIGAFRGLGKGGSPNYAALAADISHALWATLLGVGIALPAIFFYSFFRNRMSRIAVDLNLLVDDLLTQMFFSTRQAPATAQPAAAKSQPSVTMVPNKPEG